MKIKYIKAREILDSKGIPTISTLIQLDDGTVAKGEVPSGASTGKTEVLELRDNDPNRHRGKGVLTAINNIERFLLPQLVDKDFVSQEQFDKLLINIDGTSQKTNLGGNTILSLSMAFCRATAKSKKMPLYKYIGQLYWGESFTKEYLTMPEPLILVMEGGEHGEWITDIQEYMIVPRREKFENFAESLRAGAEIYHCIYDILAEKGYSVTVGLEGAFAPPEIKSNTEAFDIIMQGIERAGYKPDEQIYMAVDIASSEFYDATQRKYVLKKDNQTLSPEEWIKKQYEWYTKYPIHLTEDPMDQEDWDGWQKLMGLIGNEKQVVGDDLLTTNVERIEKAIGIGAVNSVLIKLNQIGSVTETIDAMKTAEKAGFTSVISHRSRETNDDMIADLAVGSYATQCKFGAPIRGERVAKYNRLMEIEKFYKK